MGNVDAMNAGIRYASNVAIRLFPLILGYHNYFAQKNVPINHAQDMSLHNSPIIEGESLEHTTKRIERSTGLLKIETGAERFFCEINLLAKSVGVLVVD